MINNNKILTVSYGTFSCTLEGFEDSFDTMKAIAEYFRDLAADDRYFGAEPPQPDAEMLARIAEREVSRRVEAREHEGRIMLKAHEEPLAAAAAMPREAPVPQELLDRETPAPAPQEPVPAQEPERAEAPAMDEAVAEAEDAQADAIEAEQSEPEAAEVLADAVEDAAEETHDVPDAAEAIAEEDDAAEPLTFEAAEADASEVAESAETDAPVAEQAEDDAEDAAAFFAEPVADADEDMGTEEEYETAAIAEEVAEVETFETEDVAPAAASAEVSLADKLERIRAVVSRQEDDNADAGYEEDTEEPVASQDFGHVSAHDMHLAEERDVVAEAARDISAAFDADDADQAAAAHMAELADEEDELDMVLRRLDVYHGDEDEDTAIDLSDDSVEAGQDEASDNLFASDDDDESDSDLHGRVLKVNRAQLEAAIDAGELEEYEDDDLAGAAELSPEEEAELQRDLAALEDEQPAAAHAAHGPARDSLPDIDSGSGEGVSRLMAEADHQMQEPEGKTRRSAFAHLRAAVAARFADRSMAEADKQVEQAAEAYRSDLAEVVRPRRPVLQERPERSEDARPAPLKLVAEQRIDAATEMNARGPVAPRRVAAADFDDMDLSEDTGFATYAEEHGARDLPQLLEAAAAYLAYVEGHEQFSRPQLMARVRQAECGEFSREDGLRSFGQLLRTGKIEKIKGGRFAAAEGIGFKPDHRAAG